MRGRDPYLGREILGGQFRIVERIGSGGMGAVYKADQPAMGRFVAIKILHSKFSSRADLVSRFRREARAMSHLSQTAWRVSEDLPDLPGGVRRVEPGAKNPQLG